MDQARVVPVEATYEPEPIGVVHPGAVVYGVFGDRTLKQRLYLPIKRVMDVVLSAIGLVLLAPLFLLVGLAVKLDSPGPVFFGQERVGKNGKRFKIHKFRTMKQGSEDLSKWLSPEEMEAYQKDFKLEKDPRVTRLGNFLRKTSLDELPQLFNILKGDISIVGPRPVVDKELEKYGHRRDMFLSVKPGLTGHWQVNGRNSITYEDRINMEMHYISEFSLSFDIRVILLTFPAVVRKTGV